MTEATEKTHQTTTTAVIVTGVDISFIDLLFLVTKLFLAAIPAMLLALIGLSLVIFLLGGVASLGGALAHLFTL